MDPARKREIALANLEKGRHGQKHGLYLFLGLDAEKWPVPMRKMYERRFKELMGLDHVSPDTDGGSIAQIVRLELILARVYDWLSTRPLIDDQGKVAPVLHILGVYENSLRLSYDKCGLAPESRKRLAVLRGREDWAKVLSASPAEDSGGDSGGEAVGDDR